MTHAANNPFFGKFKTPFELKKMLKDYKGDFSKCKSIKLKVYHIIISFSMDIYFKIHQYLLVFSFCSLDII